MINFRTTLAGIGMIAGFASADLPTDTISGHIMANKMLDSAHVWIIKGRTTVDSGITLSIQPGTTIKGQYSTRGTLCVNRGAYLVAPGTKAKPINFTSTELKRGGWGGIVLLGKAPTNEPTKYFEAIPEWAYGGNDAHDSSGVMTYVTINYPGFAVEVDKELNGLTLCGVGDKTVLHHIQSNNGDDDAFEFFGGTVNVSHFVATNETDDGFDMDNGYSGTGQFMMVIQGKDSAQARHYYFYGPTGDTLKYVGGPKDGQYHDTTYTEKVGDNGIEASSNPVAGKVPQSHPKWSNITVVDNGVNKGPLQFKENMGGEYSRMLLVGDSSAWMVSVLDLASANNMIAATPTLSLNKTFITGTFKSKWDVKDTSVVGKGLKVLFDSTVKYVDSALYMDMGLASTSLAADSVGAIIGTDTANYWYKGWTLPGTVVYANGKARPTVGIAARSLAKPSLIGMLSMEAGALTVQAGFATVANIQVLDLTGRVQVNLGRVNLHQGRNRLGKNEFKTLQNGLFFVRVSAVGETHSAKVMITHTEGGR